METRITSGNSYTKDVPQKGFFKVEQEVCSYDGMWNQRFFSARLAKICDGRGYEFPEGADGNGVSESAGKLRGKSVCQKMSTTIRCK